MLRDALAHSINTVAVQLADQVTPEAVVQTAKRLGINSALAAVPSIALGTSEVTLLELTGAYAPFANGGYSVLPYVVQRIRTPQGDVLFDRSQNTAPRRVISIESVALMNYMLQATVEMGTGRRADLPGWPAGGKTGTSQNFRDAWFVGYTANLTTGVWVGNDSDAPMKRAFGGTLPAEIWSKFMKVAHKGVPVQQLPGTDLVSYLLGQPPPTPGPGFAGFGGGSAEEQAANEQRMRNCMLDRTSPECTQVQAAPAQQPTRRRGFFERLFGG